MIKRTEFVLLLFILLVLIVGAIMGCSTARDNKALSRVISKQELSNRAFAVLEKQHPCVTTTTKIIQGRDSVIHDTLIDAETIDYLNGQIDSLLLTKCSDKPLNLDSIKKRIAAQIKIKCNPVEHWRVDTFFKQDDRRLDICNDTLQNTRGRYAQLQQQLSDEKKTSGKKTWWIIGLIGFIGFGIFITIHKKL